MLPAAEATWLPLFLFSSHIFHTTNPAHATRGRGHFTTARAMVGLTAYTRTHLPSQAAPCASCPRTTAPEMVGLTAYTRTHLPSQAAPCASCPRTTAPESTTTYPLVLSGTCTFLYLSSSVTHSHCFKTLSSTTTLEIAGRRTCPFRQDKSSGLISRAESQKIAV